MFIKMLSSWVCLNSFFKLTYHKIDENKGPTVCRLIGSAMLIAKCGSEAYSNMIHAVPCVKYLVSIAVTCVRDDFKVWWFIAITISYEIVRGFSVFFSWVFWSKRGKLKNKGGIGHLVCVKRCYMLEQPKRLHLRIARICLYVPLFSLFSFSMKRSEKIWKNCPCKIL